MPAIKQFKEAPNKSQFILSAQFDSSFYTKTAEIPQAERKQIAAQVAMELLAQGQEELLDAVTLKLCDLCFINKGPLFIRVGAADLFADILQAIASKTNDEKNFVTLCEKAVKGKAASKPCPFPKDYKLSAHLARIFSLIQSVANWFALNTNDQKYNTNLAQNLTNKIFFPFILNKENPVEAARLVSPFKTWATKDSKAVSDYINARITTDSRSKVTHYFEAKNLHYKNAIQSISNLILHKKWELGGFGIFKGGLTINFHGQTIRVPHRVAAMAKLIEDFENSDNVDKNIQKLYEEFKIKAQEALDTPRKGQQQSTRIFYQDVLENLYLGEDVVDLESEQESGCLKLV